MVFARLASSNSVTTHTHALRPDFNASTSAQVPGVSRAMSTSGTGMGASNQSTMATFIRNSHPCRSIFWDRVKFAPDRGTPTIGEGAGLTGVKLTSQTGVSRLTNQ